MQTLPFWKIAPFSRLCFALIAGIVLQYYLPFSFPIIALTLASLLAIYVTGNFLFPLHDQRRALIKSFSLQVFLIVLGCWLSWQKDIRHHKDWFGNVPVGKMITRVKLEENPVVKENSLKAEATVLGIDTGKGFEKTTGSIIIYFSKNATDSLLKYGDEILINKSFQRIKNAGNPGGFNYERYAAFHQWFYTTYLNTGDYLPLHRNSANWFKQQTINARTYVIKVLETYLTSNKNVLGIAEAIVIGYKDDLDKDLVQAYSNVGIVHIIAISGMHLGMIFLLLELLFGLLTFGKKSRSKIIPIIILLWAFAIVTGATPSVLRSALMFSCLLIGKNYFKKSSSYNGLALSAFILLCINPYYLWDVGFQLSYLAVFGIMWLQRPIYNLIYVKYKAADWVWQLASVSIAAQIITMPLSLLYFHQFPVLFLFTNILAIPLAMAGLYTGVALIVFSFIPILAQAIGYILFGLIWLLNYIVHFFSGLSFSLIQGIHASPLTTFFLYLFIAFMGYGLIAKNKKALILSLLAITGFSITRSFFFYQVFDQQKIVVYNVPRLSAIDFISGQDYFFRGDTALKKDAVLQNFYLKPSRVFMQSLQPMAVSDTPVHARNMYFFGGKSLMVTDSSSKFVALENKVPVDVLVVTKSSPYLNKIISAISPSVVVCDGTNSLWKIARYKKDCEVLHLPFHAVAEVGAYVLEANK